MRTKLLRLIAVLALLIAAGCGTDSGTSANNGDKDVIGDGSGNDGSLDSIGEDEYGIQTEVSTNETVAGGIIEVTCTVTLGGAPVKAETDIVVTGTDAYTFENGELVFLESGEFDVACVAAKLELEDESPETIVVGDSPVVSVETEVSANNARAGETVTVTCIATNALDEEVAGVALEVAITPTTGATADEGDEGFDFVATSTGSYDVACGTTDGTVVDETPETIQVKAGPATTVITELAEDTIDAGGSTEVTCTAEDEFGNAVGAEDLIITVPEQLTVNGSTVSGTVAGTWEVLCESADGESDTEGADLTVLALAPEGLALKLIPSKPAYQVGDQVTVGYSLVDMYGNPVPGGEIEPVAVDPMEGITQISEDEYQFEVEGLFVFSSCVVGDSSKCDEIEGWCDGTAPVVTIEYPERGATIDGDSTVHITGTVNEAVSEIVTFTINGTDVAYGEDGTFDVPMQAKQGMNMITVFASDTFGNEVNTMRSFYFSYEFYPMDHNAPGETTVNRSVRLYLDDKLFYNEDPTDTATISALLKDTLKELDIGDMIPNPAANLDQLGCQYDVYINDVTFDDPELMIRSSYAGIKLDVTVPNIVALFAIDKVSGGFWCPGDTTGWIQAASIGVSTTVFLSVTENHKLAISNGDTVVSTDGLEVNVDSWFLDLLVGLFQGTIENLVTDQFESAIADLIGGLSQSVDDLLSAPIEIPIAPLIPGMHAVTLSITIQPQAAQFDAEGGTLELNLAITAPKIVDRTILGCMARSSCLSETPEVFNFDLTDPAKLLLAAHTDVVSQLLYSFWYNGGTHLNLTSETFDELGTDLSGYGVADLNVMTSPLLPPAFTSCNDDDMLTIQLGDFYVEASFTMLGMPVDLHMYLYLEIQAEIILVDDPDQGQMLGIQIHEPTLTELDIVYLNDEWKGKEDTFRSLLLDTALPMLMEQLAEPITFALPAINLQDLLSSGGDPQPGDINLQLPAKELLIDIQDLENMMGFIYGEASIIIQDPPEEPVEPPVQ